jgi:hypothetical protein
MGSVRSRTTRPGSNRNAFQQPPSPVGFSEPREHAEQTENPLCLLCLPRRLVTSTRHVKALASAEALAKEDGLLLIFL